MYQNIDTEKLADAQNVAEKLAKLPEKVLLYIAGYAEGALAAAGKQAATEQPGAEGAGHGQRRGGGRVQR